MLTEAEALPDLNRLNMLLVREGMAHSPEVWLLIYQLLANRALQAALPNNPEGYSHLLSPLVCKNPGQQYRMLALMEEWLGFESPVVAAKVTSPEQHSAALWYQKLQQFNRRSVIGWAVGIVLALMLAVSFFYFPQAPEIKLPETTSQPPPNVGPGEAPIVPQLAIDDTLAPNPLPPPVELPANWQRWQQGLSFGISGLPVALALLWLLWHYRKRTVLRTNAPRGEQLLTRLKIDSPKGSEHTPFSGQEMTRAARELLHPVWIESLRLHIEDSVIATANNYGLFTPRYRQRLSHPEYLILVQSIHGNDQFASFAELFVTALQNHKVDIRSYRFRDDPRRLIPWIQPAHGADTETLSLKQLAQKRGAARLIVISDWNILYHPYHPDREHGWVKDFDAWLQRVWLSPDYKNPSLAKLAKEQSERLKFSLMPLNSEHLEEIVQTLLKQTPLRHTEKEQPSLPAMLAEHHDSWLDWRPPVGTDLNRLCLELKQYLGDEGFLLLQALAVFPKPLWPLPLVLDIQLFTPLVPKLQLGNQQAEAPAWERAESAKREHRLQKLSNLPRARQSYLPDYLRLKLLKTLTRKERQKIHHVWAGLIAALNTEEPLSLPIAVSKNSTLNIKDLLASEPKRSSLNDPIFANIILGGKLGLLDFTLPQLIAKVLPKTDSWLDLRPLCLALLLTALAVFGLNTYWQTQGNKQFIQFWQQRLEQQNAGWQVKLTYQTDTQPLSAALASAAQTLKFQVTQQAITGTPPPHNNIRYAPGGKVQAEELAAQLSWLSYNARVDIEQASELEHNTLKVELSQSYQHTAGFKDNLRFPYSKPRTIDKPDSTAVKFIEPQMVVIPAGSFMMGSPADESYHQADESPQHQVTIKSFAMAKTEVTFAEYDLFAQATNRKLPEDSGWGRGNRPVINVSFKDAEAYAAWLSQQTGKAYRLPTEAEWEYAARAKTQTPWFWGKDENLATDYAWYYKNSANKTQPAGGKKPNAFGLYDTAGNVWEWTQDCWHEGYKSAPNDGSAWLEAQGGQCDRRVVRGGSWSINPLYLRSAIRFRYYSVGTGNILGFRVARAL